MLNNFVNFDFLFTKLSGIDPCEKRNNIPGEYAWHIFLMACSKFETMAIYVVKQPCGNDLMACVYLLFRPNTTFSVCYHKRHAISKQGVDSFY